jgi:phage tail-like protein
MPNNKNGQETQALNYVTANRFYVEMESNITASFSECSGLGVTIKKETYLEGGVNDHQRIVLGQAEFSDVTLKRGITDDFVFWDWVSSTLNNGKKGRRNVNILLFNQAGATMQCWTLVAAIPIGWKAPALQGNSNTVAIEELTLAYEGLKIAKSQGGGAIQLKPGRHASGYFL